MAKLVSVITYLIMATIVFLLLLLLILVSGDNLNKCDEFYNLNIPQGQLLGRARKTYNNAIYYSFQGIPYAEPPIGDLRFKSSKPAKSWEGLLNATEMRVICPQPNSREDIFGNVEENEDCLFLNIFTKMPQKHQSVMVYIHGGGFEINGKELFFDPDYFIHENIVLVSIQYRLNVFGFLSIDDPKYNIPGNAGFKDQVLALKWIQQNIQYFGGDPNSVTIFGNSAGGVSVHLLTLSPMSKGLFNRAISQSGAATVPWTTSPNTYRELAVALNCKSNDLTELMNCFNNASTSDFMNALNKLPIIEKLGDLTHFNYLTIEKQNSIDPFLNEDPRVIVRNKMHNPVPFIMGFCTDEGLLFLDFYKTITKNNLTIEQLIPKRFNVPLKTELSRSLGENISEIYYGRRNATFELLDPTIEVLTDLMFFNSIYDFANLQLKAYPNNPIWFYEFRYSSTWNIFPNRTTHTDELYYLFHPNNRSLVNDMNTNSDEYIGRYRLIKLWTTFAKYGNPNPMENKYFNNITWKPLEEDKFNYLLIKPHMESNIAGSNFRHTSFWKSLYEAYEKN